MSNSTSRAFAARCALAALSFVAVAAAAHQAAAATVTRAPFQQQAPLACSGGSCHAYFIDLPANQALDVGRVWCEIFTSATGTVWRGRAYFLPAQTFPFTVPLDLLWSRTVGTSRVYTLGGELNMRVPLGRQLVNVIDYVGGSPGGTCSFTGVSLTVT